MDDSRILPEFTVEIPAPMESPILDEDVSPSSPPSPPTPTAKTPPPTQTSPLSPIVSTPSTQQIPPLPKGLQATIHGSHISDVELHEYTVGSPTNTKTTHKSQ